jgi:hypothetical protein
MSLLTSPEQDFTDIEQRLRSTYAHVTSEFVPEHQKPSVVSLRTIDSGASKRRRFGIWKPRIATLGAVAGMAFAGFNLANRSSTTTLATASPSAFKSFPHLIPTAPTGYRLDSLSRQLTPQIPGYRTEYRAASGRLPISLVVRGATFEAMGIGYNTTFISRRMVLITHTLPLMVEVSDKMCGTIGISGIKRTELLETIRHLRCRNIGTELRAELSNKKRSDLLFSGRYPQPYATLQFHFGNVQEPDFFEIAVEPCRCESVTFSPNSSGEVRIVDGRSVTLAPEKGPDGIVMQRRTVFWAPTSTAMVRLDSPVGWDWTQIEAVIRGVKEVDQATFTALLESNGIREVSLLP